MSTDITPSDVVAFWKEAGPGKWFAKDDAFDSRFRRGFGDAHFAAARRELDDWADTAEGCLALLLLLDQFPRNLYRGTGHAFATDPLAKKFAERAVAAGFDKAVEAQLQNFFHLPFEHSEALADQDRAVELAVDADALKWAVIHRDIIARFGRFPHRNAALGRETTAEEQAFLDSGGFAG
jgi:uncharacterized protein (DUF924 family)